MGESDWDWCCSLIEVHDYVIVLCAQEDAMSLSLPNSSRKVWVAKCIDFDVDDNLLTGDFLYNTQASITAPLDRSKRDRVSVTDEVVMSIFSPDDDAAFSLNEENIAEIERYVALVSI